MKKKVYAPGCALMIYKPELADRAIKTLEEEFNGINEHLICCRHNHNLEKGTEIINTCSGCDRRYRELFKDITTVTLWERLSESKNFPFPNYNGIEMAIHDACPTRNRIEVHTSIRRLLERMNIKIVEPKHTGANSICCGDSFYGILPLDKQKEMMKKRAMEMPCEDVVVYCVSCIKSMHIGGKKPRYILDLLFAENTEIGIFEPEEWHKVLQEYIDNH